MVTFFYDFPQYFTIKLIEQTKMKSHYQVLIIGGGTAGIMTAAQLLNKNKAHGIQRSATFKTPLWNGSSTINTTNGTKIQYIPITRLQKDSA